MGSMQRCKKGPGKAQAPADSLANTLDGIDDLLIQSGTLSVKSGARKSKSIRASAGRAGIPVKTGDNLNPLDDRTFSSRALNLHVGEALDKTSHKSACGDQKTRPKEPVRSSSCRPQPAPVEKNQPDHHAVERSQSAAGYSAGHRVERTDLHGLQLYEVENIAREAAMVGDNARAARICLDGIERFGEEPTLIQMFKEACARLGVSHVSRSHPSRVFLTAKNQIVLGDDLPVAYSIHFKRHQNQQLGATVPSGGGPGAGRPVPCCNAGHEPGMHGATHQDSAAIEETNSASNDKPSAARNAQVQAASDQGLAQVEIGVFEQRIATS